MCSVDSNLDLSSATKFFKDAILLAREDAKLSILHKGSIKEIEDIEGEAIGWILYDNIPGISFKKFYAVKGTKIHRQLCKCRFSIVVADIECDATISTDYITVRLSSEKKFFYICENDKFSVEFHENSWFYILSIPT